jgi:hypothetical protein
VALRKKIVAMAETLKLSFLTYLRHLGAYDFIGLVWFGFTFLALIVLAIFIAKRSSALALLLIIFALIFFAIAPFALKYKLNDYLRPTSTHVHTVKKLTFSDSIIIEATLNNLSSKDFSICLFQTQLFKKTSQEGIRKYLAQLKPLANQSILVRQPFLAGESFEYKTLFDDFSYAGDVEATLKAECY